MTTRISDKKRKTIRVLSKQIGEKEARRVVDTTICSVLDAMVNQNNKDSGFIDRRTKQ